MFFETLLIHPTVQAIGRALLHFIWQGALLAAILFLANASLTRRTHARLRYAAASAVMLLMPAVFIATIFLSHPFYQPASSPQRAAIVPAPVADLPVETATLPGRGLGGATVSPAKPAPSFVTALPGWAVCFWMAGFVALSIFTTAGWIRVQHLRSRGISPVNPAWIDTLEDLMRRLQVSIPVRLYASTIAQVPAVIGWLRPYILLPLSAMTGLGESQMRAVLAHELAHIRRHDYLVNLLQTAVETLLFYHPAVWWVSGRIREEREHCCDDLAVAVCGDAMAYADALAHLEELRGGISEPALAATGGDLLSRIRRLMGQDCRDRIPGPVGVTVAIALLAGVVIAAMNAPVIRAQSPAPAPQAVTAPAPPVRVAQLQPPPQIPPPVQTAAQHSPPAATPKFDVASVKRCMPGDEQTGTGGRGGGGGRGPRFSPGRLTIQCMDVAATLGLAYVDGATDRPANYSRLDPVEKRIRGGAPWVYSDWYTIEAETGDPEANGSTDRGLSSPAVKVMIGPMLRAVLADRFQLKIHSGVEEIPMYALTVAKGGLKMQPLKEGVCKPLEPGKGISPPQPGEKPICGGNISDVNGPNRTWS